MSLRIRLISLIAVVLAVSLCIEGTIVVFNASRSVQTEIGSALQVGEQIVRSGLTRVSESSERRRALIELVAAFEGSRHIRVSWPNGAATSAEPPPGDTHFGPAPPWFAQILGTAPHSVQLPIVIAGQDYGKILIEADPKNEVLEIWNSLGDSAFMLILFFALSILLVYSFIGRALQPLDLLAAALARVSLGDYTIRVGGKTVPEVSQLQNSFNRMAIELAALDEEKRRLNERLLVLQDEERGEIARDLHDEVSPFLFAVNADLASISRLAGQGRSAEISKQIHSALDAVSHIQFQIKALLLRLRPAVLEDFGLSAAILSMVDFWRRRRPKINFDVRLPADGASFGRAIDNAVYRIVQESLTNAVRHGDPTKIWVTVTETGEGPEFVMVEVRNDGDGAKETTDSGFGLTGMRERIQALGGRLILAKSPGLGLSVTTTLPLTARRNSACTSQVSGSA